MGSDNTSDDTPEDTAAARLAHLQRYHREHPVTGPAEGSRRTVVHPSAPLSLATLDHVTASVREIADHTYAINPEAGPVPAAAAAVYDWCHEHTEHADEVERDRVLAVEYRHYLEHAIRAGDHTVVCKHRCPACRTWGLMWDASRQKAVCTHRRCTTRNNLSSTWSLARLAFAHVAEQKNLRQASAT